MPLRRREGGRAEDGPTSAALLLTLFFSCVLLEADGRRMRGDRGAMATLLFPTLFFHCFDSALN